MPDIEIRKIALEDKGQWEDLFKGYASFYEMNATDLIIEEVWSWLHASSKVHEALVAEIDGKIVGFAHFRPMPSPLRGKDVGFLDDLFVHQDYRGKGVAKALLQGVNDISAKKGWGIVRWITKESNSTAKSLYDKVAQKTDWELYEMK